MTKKGRRMHVNIAKVENTSVNDETQSAKQNVLKPIRSFRLVDSSKSFRDILCPNLKNDVAPIVIDETKVDLDISTDTIKPDLENIQENVTVNIEEEITSPLGNDIDWELVTNKKKLAKERNLKKKILKKRNFKKQLKSRPIRCQKLAVGAEKVNGNIKTEIKVPPGKGENIIKKDRNAINKPNGINNAVVAEQLKTKQKNQNKPPELKSIIPEATIPGNGGENFDVIKQNAINKPNGINNAVVAEQLKTKQKNQNKPPELKSIIPEATIPGNGGKNFDVIKQNEKNDINVCENLKPKQNNKAKPTREEDKNLFGSIKQNKSKATQEVKSKPSESNSKELESTIPKNAVSENAKLNQEIESLFDETNPTKQKIQNKSTELKPIKSEATIPGNGGQNFDVIKQNEKNDINACEKLKAKQNNKAKPTRKEDKNLFGSIKQNKSKAIQQVQSKPSESNSKELESTIPKNAVSENAKPNQETESIVDETNPSKQKIQNKSTELKPIKSEATIPGNGGKTFDVIKQNEKNDINACEKLKAKQNNKAKPTKKEDKNLFGSIKQNKSKSIQEVKSKSSESNSKELESTIPKNAVSKNSKPNQETKSKFDETDTTQKIQNKSTELKPIKSEATILGNGGKNFDVIKQNEKNDINVSENLKAKQNNKAKPTKTEDKNLFGSIKQNKSKSIQEVKSKSSESNSKELESTIPKNAVSKNSKPNQETESILDETNPTKQKIQNKPTELKSIKPEATIPGNGGKHFDVIKQNEKNYINIFEKLKPKHNNKAKPTRKEKKNLCEITKQNKSKPTQEVKSKPSESNSKELESTNPKNAVSENSKPNQETESKPIKHDEEYLSKKVINESSMDGNCKDSSQLVFDDMSDSAKLSTTTDYNVIDLDMELLNSLEATTRCLQYKNNSSQNEQSGSESKQNQKIFAQEIHLESNQNSESETCLGFLSESYHDDKNNSENLLASLVDTKESNDSQNLTQNSQETQQPNNSIMSMHPLDECKIYKSLPDPVKRPKYEVYRKDSEGLCDSCDLTVTSPWLIEKVLPTFDLQDESCEPNLTNLVSPNETRTQMKDNAVLVDGFENDDKKKLVNAKEEKNEISISLPLQIEELLFMFEYSLEKLYSIMTSNKEIYENIVTNDALGALSSMIFGEMERKAESAEIVEEEINKNNAENENSVLPEDVMPLNTNQSPEKNESNKNVSAKE